MATPSQPKHCLEQPSKRATMLDENEWQVELDRGLHLLRYVSCDANPPLQLGVRCLPPTNSVVMHPDLAEASLSRPGSSLVVRSIGKGNILLYVLDAQTDPKQGGEIEVTIEELEY